MENPKPREDVIRFLASEALEAMEECGVADLTPSEVVSACFTLTKNVMLATLTHAEEPYRTSCKHYIQTAVLKLYEMVAPEITH